MREARDAIFAFTYAQEGGYSNDAHDPGGATNLGIIQIEYNAYRQQKGLPAQSVRYIKKEEADEIYLNKYWNKIDGDELPAGVDLVIYDYAVNSGPYRAIRYAQWAVGVKVDGIMGPITMSALKSVDPRKFVIDYDTKRLSFLQGLSIYQYFGKGWTRRVKAATNKALALIGEKPKYTESPQVTETPMPLFFDVVLGIVRHVVTGGGAVVATNNGFDANNPTTWVGILIFIGGAAYSVIEKLRSKDHVDLLTAVKTTIEVVDEKLKQANPETKA